MSWRFVSLQVMLDQRSGGWQTDPKVCDNWSSYTRIIEAGQKHLSNVKGCPCPFQQSERLIYKVFVDGRIVSHGVQQIVQRLESYHLRLDSPGISSTRQRFEVAVRKGLLILSDVKRRMCCSMLHTSPTAIAISFYRSIMRILLR